MKKKLFSILLSGLVSSAPLIAFKPQKAQAQGIKCTPYTYFQHFKTANNPHTTPVQTYNIQDGAIKATSNVVASVSEEHDQSNNSHPPGGGQFLGNAIFSVLDVAPYNGGFNVRVRVDTGIQDHPLSFDVVYLAC